LAAFFSPLFWVFVAELGDKTQLVALCFATRFNARVVMLGVFAATLLVHVGSVALAQLAHKSMPEQWAMFLAGLAFIAFGLWTLRGDEADEDACQNKQGRSPFWIVATTFFLAELGDKTMLTTIQQGMVYPGAPVQVWIGSTLGMVVSDGLAIWVGSVLGKRLPERAIKVGAAILFLGFGAASLYAVRSRMPMLAWVAGGAAVLAMIYAFFGRRSKAQPLPLVAEVVEEKVPAVK